MNGPAQHKPNGPPRPTRVAGRRWSAKSNELARQHAPAAFERICDLVENSDERDRIGSRSPRRIMLPNPAARQNLCSNWSLGSVSP
jgi:hypothetical protein